MRSFVHIRNWLCVSIFAAALGSSPASAQIPDGNYVIRSTWNCSGAPLPDANCSAELSWEDGLATVEFGDRVEWRISAVDGKANTYEIFNTRGCDTSPPSEWCDVQLSWTSGDAGRVMLKNEDPVQWRISPVAGKPNTYEIFNTLGCDASPQHELCNVQFSWTDRTPHPAVVLKEDDPVEWLILSARIADPAECVPSAVVLDYVNNYDTPDGPLDSTTEFYFTAHADGHQFLRLPETGYVAVAQGGAGFEEATQLEGYRIPLDRFLFSFTRVTFEIKVWDFDNLGPDDYLTSIDLPNFGQTCEPGISGSSGDDIEGVQSVNYYIEANRASVRAPEDRWLEIARGIF